MSSPLGYISFLTLFNILFVLYYYTIFKMSNYWFPNIMFYESLWRELLHKYIILDYVSRALRFAVKNIYTFMVIFWNLKIAFELDVIVCWKLKHYIAVILLYKILLSCYWQLSHYILTAFLFVWLHLFCLPGESWLSS